MSRAIGIGIEIAQRATQATGAITAFEMDSTGNYGGVAWLAAFSNIAEMQEAESKLALDTNFAGMYFSARCTAGFLRKLCSVLIPATAGTSAAGILGSLAFAQCCSPLTMYR